MVVCSEKSKYFVERKIVWRDTKRVEITDRHAIGSTESRYQ